MSTPAMAPEAWDLDTLCEAFIALFVVPRQPVKPVTCRPRVYENHKEPWKTGPDAKNYYTLMDPQSVGRANEGIHRGYG
jgi:hypothetical protein